MSLSNEFSSPRNRGYHQPDMLVVIAIISLLIGILLPALGKSRQSARIARFMDYLKNVDEKADDDPDTNTETFARDSFCFTDAGKVFTARQGCVVDLNTGEQYSFDKKKGVWSEEPVQLSEKEWDAFLRRSEKTLVKLEKRDDEPEWIAGQLALLQALIQSTQPASSEPEAEPDASQPAAGPQ